MSIVTDHAGARPETLPRLSHALTFQYHLLVANVIKAEEFVVTEEYTMPEKSMAVDRRNV